MNHDGETKEGNFCDSDMYLMSPVLGPGKVTWSTCSNRELSQFMATHPQAVCLEDRHQPQPKYDYAKNGTSPGEHFMEKMYVRKLDRFISVQNLFMNGNDRAFY